MANLLTRSKRLGGLAPSDFGAGFAVRRHAAASFDQQLSKSNLLAPGRFDPGTDYGSIRPRPR